MSDTFDFSELSDMDLVFLQAQLKESTDPSDIEFRKQILIELGRREKERAIKNQDAGKEAS